MPRQQNTKKAEPEQKILGVQIPRQLRKNQWYVRSDGSRYRFEDDGATYEETLPAVPDQNLRGTWERVLLCNKNGEYLSIDKVRGGKYENEFVFVEFTSSPDDDGSTIKKLKGFGLNAVMRNGPVVQKGEIDAMIVAHEGERVTILKNAPVEATENTVSVSWSNADESLLLALNGDRTPKRFRIQDDGLSLVNIRDSSSIFTLSE